MSVVLTTTQSQQLLDLHNSIRSSVTPPAADMEGMYWDSTLVSSASSIAQSGAVCPNTTAAPTVFSSVGVNIAYIPIVGSTATQGTVAQLQITNAVTAWTQAGSLYSFNSNACSGPSSAACTPWLNMIYYDAWRVGCARSWQPCGNVPVTASSGVTAPGLGYAMVCVYANTLQGNAQPYSVGLPCSSCSANYASCSIPSTCLAAGGTCPGLCAVGGGLRQTAHTHSAEQ